MNKILIISHIDPVQGKSGQEQRVKYTIKALKDKMEVVYFFGTYDNSKVEKIKNKFSSEFKDVKLHVFKGKKTIFDKFQAFFVEYFIGLKASNYYISKLFRYGNLKSNFDLRQFDLILFEYWHAFKSAGLIKINFPGIITICDTHNILSSTYNIYLGNHFFKKYLQRLYFLRYRNIEFNRALPSFSKIISINRSEHDLLIEKFGNDRVIYCGMGIDIDVFNTAAPLSLNDEFLILYYGGLGSEHNRSAAIDVYDLIVLRAIKSGLNVRLRIVGSNSPDEFKLNFDSKYVDFVGFSNSIMDDFKNVSLAVIPWTGKYGFRSRLIEIMACNIPVFTTTDAVWGMGFRNNHDIITVSDFNRKAYDVFLNLFSQYDRLEAISKNAKKFIENEYSFKSTYLRLGDELSILPIQNIIPQ